MNPHLVDDVDKARMWRLEVGLQVLTEDRAGRGIDDLASVLDIPIVDVVRGMAFGDAETEAKLQQDMHLCVETALVGSEVLVRPGWKLSALVEHSVLKLLTKVGNCKIIRLLASFPG